MRRRERGVPLRYDDDFRGLIAGVAAVPVLALIPFWGQGGTGTGARAMMLVLGCVVFLVSSAVYFIWMHLLFVRTPPERLRRIAGSQHRSGPSALLRAVGFGSAENVAVSAAGVALIVAIAAAVFGSAAELVLLPVLVLLTAVLAWVSVVYAFALRYLRLDAAGERIAFDIDESPRFGDFLSMAVMISAVGALSAGTPRTRAGLDVVRTHTVIAFAFNALVVAMTVLILTGMSPRPPDRLDTDATPDVRGVRENGDMGRGDGSGRIVSSDDADDTGSDILHVDMDAFYAAVEVLHDPSLRGLPLIIGSPDGRSVVSSASYEARRFGVRSAMPVSQALRLCPAARIVPPDFRRYQEVSRQVMAIFESITPLVEPLSIDEAFLDVRGVRRLWGGPAEIARLIRRRVAEEVGITCSVGVAATKHVAKMASTIAKPDGLLVIAEADTRDFLADRSVRAMWGVGPKAAEALESRGIRFIRDIRSASEASLERAVGAALGMRLRDLAEGRDPRAVQTTRVEKSIGHEETFDVDVLDRESLRSELLRLADRVAARLRKAEWEAGGVAIKVRFADFTTINRSQTLFEPTSVGQRIGEVARGLFDAVERRDPVRLIGVRAERLGSAGSGMALWDDDADWRRVEGAVDDARARFGSAMITRARHLGIGEGSGAPQHPRSRSSE